MTLEYIKDSDLIKAQSDEITDLGINIGLYSSVQALTNLTCADADKDIEYDMTEILSTDSDFYLVAVDSALYFKPAAFSLLTYLDGIYKVTLKIRPLSGGFTQIQNCIFVDITLKCKVATLLKSVLDNGNSTMAHLLHYSLVNGSNCGCNCDELCINYNALQEVIVASGADGGTGGTTGGTSNSSNCGCN